MTIENNKSIIRHYYESTGNEETVKLFRQVENPAAEAEKTLKIALAEVFSSDCVIHYPEGDKTIEEDIRNLAAQVAAFPDMKTNVNDMIAEGDKVVTRFTLQATHDGPYMGIPATGKKIKLEVISIYRLENGKVVEGWWLGDMLGVLQQLGVIPG
jgi:steroid delta-isomerase-like uncharacterized protein